MRTLLIHLVALFCVLLPDGLAQRESCEYCKPRRICSVHREEEKETLRELRNALKAEREADRLAALERVAALAHAHCNAPSANAAQFLAAGLADPSMSVRVRAAELLADGQEPETAIKALVAELANVRRELERVRKAAEAGALDAAAGYGVAVIAALGRLADDRSVRALTGFLPRLGAHEPAPRLIRAGVSALSALGSREAAQWIIEARAGLPEPDQARAELVALGERVGVEAPTEPQGDSAWSAWDSELLARLPQRLGRLRIEDGDAQAGG